LRGFTTDLALAFGTGGTAKTNVLVDGVEVLSLGGDGLFLQSWSDVTAVNCRFWSTYDCIADFQTNTASLATQAVLKVYNCELEAAYAGVNTTIRGVALGGGTYRFYGGSVRALNGTANNEGFITQASQRVPTLELYGVSIYVSSTNGPATAIKNTNGASVSGSYLSNGVLVAVYVPVQRTLSYTGSGAAGTNVSADFSLGNAAYLLATNNIYLTPANIKAGHTVNIAIRQDGTGSRLLSYSPLLVKTNASMALSTAAGALDVVTLVGGPEGTNVLAIVQRGFQ
jgi:hypothetical protein